MLMVGRQDELPGLGGARPKRKWVDQRRQPPDRARLENTLLRRDRRAASDAPAPLPQPVVAQDCSVFQPILTAAGRLPTEPAAHELEPNVEMQPAAARARPGVLERQQ